MCGVRILFVTFRINVLVFWFLTNAFKNDHCFWAWKIFCHSVKYGMLAFSNILYFFIVFYCAERSRKILLFIVNLYLCVLL